LDWVFAEVEDAIIVEDDCLPDQSFFPFCQALLERYRNDGRISHITGSNAEMSYKRAPCSYYFSRYSPSWGWATWRRAWVHFDLDMRLWPALYAGGWHRDMFRSAKEAEFFAWWWDEIRKGHDDTWDGPWLLARLVQGTYGIIPSFNLVSNIGFGPGARCSSSANHPLANVPTQAMSFPLRHPPWMICDAEADAVFAEQFQFPVQAGKPLRECVLERIRNPHWYGTLLRRLPVVGPAWTRWRARRHKVACGNTARGYDDGGERI
jgi:hypothetical protein